MNTERNWLIRTTQNQILGPVAKAKVIEFLEKGALGLNDEVTSGNGYWFSLKEKDLVEKFLYGDIPQGYNPISESKSVLSKRENPDKTTSLNTAPANKTQVLKTSNEGPGVLPKNEDLEYPDITLITSSPVSAAPSAASAEDVKLPNQDDLEFPDITIVARPVTSTMQSDHGGQVHTQTQSQPVQMKSRPAEVQDVRASDEPVVYPKDDDLEFPDMGGAKETEAEEEELDFQVNVAAPKAATASAPAPASEAEPEHKPVKKPGLMNFQNEVGDDPNLTLMFDTLGKEDVHSKPQPPKPEKVESLRLEKKSGGQHQPVQTQKTHEPHQPEKLLHERKVKNSSQQKETTKDLPREVQERALPDNLKKRNDNYLLYLLVIIVLIILALFFYYYRTILNKPLPV